MLVGWSAALLVLAPAAPALAAGETARADIAMSPSAGKLYRELPRPVNWRVEAEITAPPESPLVLPMKFIRTVFPEEMSFNPDPAMPACPDSAVGPPPTYISEPPETIIARCPDSVLGNGSSTVYLASINRPEGPGLTDGDLVMFNGGRYRDGSPRLKVYGFSASLATGTYFEGRMRKNVLRVEIAQLAVDSAVGSFDLNIPGSSSPFPARRGKDPGYVRATCADGQWSGFSEFTLGRRDSDSSPIGAESIVRSNDVVKPCSGKRGRARLEVVATRKVAGKRGRERYRVSVRNLGTASARDVLVKADGRGFRGKARIGRIPPRKVRAAAVAVARGSAASGTPRFRLRFRR